MTIRVVNGKTGVSGQLALFVVTTVIRKFIKREAGLALGEIVKGIIL